MAFTPITSSQDLSYAYNNSTYYRSATRESAWGSPVYFVEGASTGFGGPHYRTNYNYNNSPETAKGNCTWWCAGRCQEANGVSVGANGVYGDAVEWYGRYTGDKSTNINNLHAGDIIVFSGGDAGHVMFVEQISGSTVTISQSAWSTRSVWDNKSCLVTSYSLSELSYGSTVDMYKGLASAYNVTVIGYLHTGSEEPTTQYLLSLSVSPDGAGYITGDPAGYYDAGSEVTFEAHANSGYTFKYWQGRSIDYSNPKTETMNRDRSYIAYFESEDTEEIIACTMAIKKKKGQINEITILV